MDKKQALNRAAGLCSGSEHCSADIHERLLRWDVDEETAADIMAHLVAEGFIDDTRYARAFTHDRIRYHHWGRIKIAYALRQKGIDSVAINEAMHAIDDEWADEYDEALRRAVDTKGTDRSKAMRHAASRGFTADEIHRAMR